jgi:hypothetical protein
VAFGLRTEYARGAHGELPDSVQVTILFITAAIRHNRPGL